MEVLCAKDIYDQQNEQSREILGDDFVNHFEKRILKSSHEQKPLATYLILLRAEG